MGILNPYFSYTNSCKHLSQTMLLFSQSLITKIEHSIFPIKYYLINKLLNLNLSWTWAPWKRIKFYSITALRMVLRWAEMQVSHITVTVIANLEQQQQQQQRHHKQHTKWGCTIEKNRVPSILIVDSAADITFLLAYHIITISELIVVFYTAYYYYFNRNCSVGKKK